MRESRTKVVTVNDYSQCCYTYVHGSTNREMRGAETDVHSFGRDHFPQVFFSENDAGKEFAIISTPNDFRKMSFTVTVRDRTICREPNSTGIITVVKERKEKKRG